MPFHGGWENYLHLSRGKFCCGGGKLGRGGKVICTYPQAAPAHTYMHCTEITRSVVNKYGECMYVITFLLMILHLQTNWTGDTHTIPVKCSNNFIAYVHMASVILVCAFSQ